MKYILLLTLLASTPLIAQTQYSRGVAYTIIFNKQMEVVKEIPMGQDVLISYDEFYDSYDIMMTSQDGMMSFNLNYIKTDDDKKIYVDKDSSVQNDFFYTEDRLSTEGKLILIQIATKEVNGEIYRIVIKFEDLEKSR